MKVEIENGKYTIIQSDDGGVHALRYHQPWRDCVGDSLILCMAQEIENLREQITNAKDCLVCAAISDPSEVCKNTLKILEDVHR